MQVGIRTKQRHEGRPVIPAVLFMIVVGGSSAARPSPFVTQTRLAGQSFPNYPYFQYVNTFDNSLPIEVALDPTVFPAIVGQSCDLYIVAARVEAEWTEQRTLIDARPGGAQTITFAGSTIRANTFVVAGPGQLSANAGAGLGVGYDVVLDLDRDGLLGPGDYIDGRGDEAGFYCVHDTTLPGPLALSEVLYSGGTFLDQVVYFPTAISSMGRLPLVVVSHGWTHDYRWYGHIGRHLASYGYIVMAHRNDVGSGNATGTQTASITTLTNTDYIIGNQATIAGGVLDHVCFLQGVTSSEDASPVPLDRAAFYYIAAAVTANGEGSLGQASSDLDPLAPGEQLERPNSAPCS